MVNLAVYIFAKEKINQSMSNKRQRNEGEFVGDDSPRRKIVRTTSSSRNPPPPPPPPPRDTKR